MSFGKQFFIYGVTGAVSRLAALLLVPIYTRSLSVPEYGQLEILLAVHMLLVLMIGLQGESAVARDYYRANEQNWLPELVWGAIWIVALGTAVTALLVVAAHAAWTAPNNVGHYLPYLLALSLPTHLLGVQLVFIRFSGRPLLYSVLSLSDFIATTLSSVYFIVFLNWGISGALAGLATGKLLTVVAAWPVSFGSEPSPIGGLRRMRGMLAYSLPTMPAVILNWLQTIGTRVIWAFFLPIGAVAIGGVGIRAASLFGLVVYSFRLAWEPQAFRLLDGDEGDRSRYARMLELSVLGLFVTAGAAILASPLTVAIFAPAEYREATGLVPAFVLMHFWLGVGMVTTIGIHGARVTSRLTYVYVLAASAHLALLALLSQRLGVEVTALALLLSTIVGAFAGAWFSNHHFNVGFSWRLLSVSAIVTLAVGALAYLRPSFGETLWPDPLLVIGLLVGLVSLAIFGISAARRAAMMTEFADLGRSVRSRFASDQSPQ
ncbi:lipopolysaccharide biosynthesis protein [Altererythrobacter sp. Root672]|uniref:lipopolysaccharide biosynthesis protein n=1 Tax=Altererythrobacter sp. Root672 TaxID=1736584 RepID=UPI000725AAA8|nr:oligosaccharide flippase family protein [Altererythrobacter sp. Root672]KRA83193.1 hypothetical protein ASD76_03745 [Altererythrobacter sp. Root672]